jgi:AcrR family transcriptional regulator
VGPATPQRRTDRRQTRRVRLIEAYVRLVGEAGCDGAAIGQLCRAAGVSTRAFYATFGSKEACYVAGFDLRARDVVARARTACLASDGTWEERVAAGLASIMGDLAADPGYARFCTVEVMRAGPDAEDRLRAVIAECRRIFDDVRQEDQRCPREEDPLASMGVGAILQPVAAYVRGGRADRLPEMVPTFVRFLARMLPGAPVA